MQKTLKGRKFGQWLVLDPGQRKFYWLCKCSCGGEYEVRQTHLTTGASTKCLPFRYASQKRKHPVSEPTDASKGAWFRYRRTVKGRYSLLKRKCKYRKIAFDLDFEAYQALVGANKCEYCSYPLAVTGIGLDRKNRCFGYVVGNVVPACASCNTQKGFLEGAGFSPERVLELMQELKHANISIDLHRKKRPWRDGE
jgi:hypothetical protein